ncbi:MAG: prepilin-type N-terminal cleavage/methylation domain-containing protein [Pseudomonadota bacterium]
MRPFDNTRSREAGFSLMEAIVAVAILGVASVPLLVLQSQNARSVIRLENSASQILAERVAVDYLSMIDVTAEQAGNIDIGGGWQLSWRATSAADAADTVMGVGQQGRYAAQLVRITAVAIHSDGREFDTELFRTAFREQFPYRQ